MQRKRQNRIIVMAVITVMAVQSVEAVTTTLFAGSTFDSDTAAMDAALGITGFNIEDFEDVNLLPDLTVETTAPNSGPLNILPRTYTDGSAGFSNNAWDGTNALVNTSTNEIWFGPGGDLQHLIAQRTTFHLSNGASSFGIGLGNFQEVLDHAVFVNGIEVISVLDNEINFTSGVNLRNGYLRIDAGPGETIFSVAFEVRLNGTQTPVGGASSDGLIFDHLAFRAIPANGAVPEPITAALGLMGLGVLGMATRRRA